MSVIIYLFHSILIVSVPKLWSGDLFIQTQIRCVKFVMQHFIQKCLNTGSLRACYIATKRLTDRAVTKINTTVRIQNKFKHSMINLNLCKSPNTLYFIMFVNGSTHEV